MYDLDGGNPYATQGCAAQEAKETRGMTAFVSLYFLLHLPGRGHKISGGRLRLGVKGDGSVEVVLPTANMPMVACKATVQDRVCNSL